MGIKKLVGLGEEKEGMTVLENEDVYFTIPTKPTVRQQLAFMGHATYLPQEEMFMRLWKGAVTLINDWKCKVIPDIKELNLDDVNDPAVTTVVIWVGMQVKLHMNKLDEVPKN